MHDSRLLKAEKLRRLYAADPVLYIEQELGAKLWHKTEEIARALVKYGRVLVQASHSIGKTHLGGALVNWHYDVHDPSITLTTAPTKLQVEDLLWKEVRVQRGRRRHHGSSGLLPKSPRMESSPDHFAVGFTASKPDAFQGRHETRLLQIYDEATGVDSDFWDASEGMMTGPGCMWLAILNPTDTSSRAYIEAMSGAWHVITVSAMDHPNISAELRGEAPPFPAAVRLGWLEDRIKRWCTPISPNDRKPGDFEFPPGSGLWHRPGPLFEGRVLGRWPTNASTSVWSEALWEAALEWQPVPQRGLEIGCDVARYGDDNTEIVVRRGPCVLHHEWHNGWGTTQIAGRLKQLAKQFCEKGEDPRFVPCKIDDDGVGGGVVDLANGFDFIGVGAGTEAMAPEDYPNRRSELWFTVADRAARGALDLSRLSEESMIQLRTQAFAPRWKLDSDGRRVVEPKDDIKKRIGRSPDGMDALNLAFAFARRRQMSAAAGGKSASRGYKPR